MKHPNGFPPGSKVKYRNLRGEWSYGVTPTEAQLRAHGYAGTYYTGRVWAFWGGSSVLTHAPLVKTVLISASSKRNLPDWF